MWLIFSSKWLKFFTAVAGRIPIGSSRLQAVQLNTAVDERAHKAG